MTFAKGLGLGLVVGAAVGAGVFAFVSAAGERSDRATQEATETIAKSELDRLREIEKQHAASSSPTLRAAAAEVQTLRSNLEAERTKREALERRVEELATAEAAPASLSGPRYRFGLKGETPIFDKQDWGKLGTHVHAMLKLTPEMRDDWLRNGMPSSQILKKINPHSMQVMSLMGAEGELEGRGPYGGLGHPVVLANLLRTTLVAAELPLTKAQETDIGSLGEKWSADWAKQTAEMEATTPELEKMLAEALAKHAFMEGVRALLSPEQRAAVWPENVQDRLMIDMFSSAGMFMLRQPLNVPKRAEMRDQLIDRLLLMAKAPQADRTLFVAIGDQWLQAIPEGYLEPVHATSLESLFPHLDRLQVHARAQIAAVREAVAQGHLTDEQAKALRESSTLITPYVVKTE